MVGLKRVERLVWIAVVAATVASGATGSAGAVPDGCTMGAGGFAASSAARDAALAQVQVFTGLVESERQFTGVLGGG